ncbi:MAG: hypothetical protein QM723_04705 [Myxococcaceae bacterium]
MTTFTTYFTDEMCAECLRDGLDGKPIDAIGHRGRLLPRVGDTVVIITERRRVLFVLAAFELQKVEEEIERLADFCPDYGDAVLARTVLRGKPLAPLRFDRALTELQVKQWIYESASGPRPITGLFDRRGSVRSFAKVSAETAEMLDRVLGLAPSLQSLPGPKALEAKLRDAPGDEQLAQVLADAWQGAGDPRGELLSLELALRRETDPARVREIDLRVSELSRKNRDLRKRPGGFPFRSVWGTREVFELDAHFERRTPSLEAALAGAGTWVELEGVSKLVFRMSRIPRPLEEQLEDLGGTQSWTDRPLGREWEWRRRSLMPIDALRPWLLEYPLTVTFAGRARMPDGCAVPLLTQQVWRGTRPMSQATLQFDGHVSRTMHLVLRLPEGTAYGAALEARLRDEMRAQGYGVRRRQVAWGPDGAARELPGPLVPRFIDPVQRRIMDPPRARGRDDPPVLSRRSFERY